MARKQQYEEGDWFTVPLRNGGYALGLVARCAAGHGVVLGYFFGPALTEIPVGVPCPTPASTDAVLVRIFGDLHLIESKWRLVGRSDIWTKGDWPMPSFGRAEDGSGRAWKVDYAEENPKVVVREVPCDPADVRGLPRDVLAGAGAIEIALTRILSLPSRQML